jgi:hypothetical protein
MRITNGKDEIFLVVVYVQNRIGKSYVFTSYAVTYDKLAVFNYPTCL